MNNITIIWACSWCYLPSDQHELQPDEVYVCPRCGTHGLLRFWLVPIERDSLPEPHVVD